MAYQGVIEDFQAIRELQSPRRIPAVACSEEFDVRWHGRYCYEEFCQDGDKMVEVFTAAIEEFDYDWAWLQIDDCFEFEPAGIVCKGQGNILRATTEYLPASRESLRAMPVLDPERDGRMPEKLKAIRRLRQRFGDTVLITGSIGAPFSACGLTWGLEQAMMVMLDDPALLHEGMEYWLEFYKRYIKAQQKAGAHAIWLGDCNAFSGLLSVDQYNQHVLSQTRELVRYAEEELDIIIWMHNSEVKLPHVLSHLPLGVSIENIGPGGDMREIRESTRGRQAISGNLDPLEVLWKGTPESIAKDVERIMDICAPGGGFALCTGEMNPRATPEENMHAYIDAARRFSP